MPALQSTARFFARSRMKDDRFAGPRVGLYSPWVGARGRRCTASGLLTARVQVPKTSLKLSGAQGEELLPYSGRSLLAPSIAW